MNTAIVGNDLGHSFHSLDNNKRWRLCSLMGRWKPGAGLYIVVCNLVILPISLTSHASQHHRLETQGQGNNRRNRGIGSSQKQKITLSEFENDAQCANRFAGLGLNFGFFKKPWGLCKPIKNTSSLGLKIYKYWDENRLSKRKKSMTTRNTFPVFDN